MTICDYLKFMTDVLKKQEDSSCFFLTILTSKQIKVNARINQSQDIIFEQIAQ